MIYYAASHLSASYGLPQQHRPNQANARRAGTTMAAAPAASTVFRVALSSRSSASFTQTQPSGVSVGSFPGASPQQHTHPEQVPIRPARSQALGGGKPGEPTSAAVKRKRQARESAQAARARRQVAYWRARVIGVWAWPTRQGPAMRACASSGPRHALVRRSLGSIGVSGSWRRRLGANALPGRGKTKE